MVLPLALFFAALCRSSLLFLSRSPRRFPTLRPAIRLQVARIKLRRRLAQAQRSTRIDVRPSPLCNTAPLAMTQDHGREYGKQHAFAR
jgi:hypothetical protein